MKSDHVQQLYFSSTAKFAMFYKKNQIFFKKVWQTWRIIHREFDTVITVNKKEKDRLQENWKSRPG